MQENNIASDKIVQDILSGNLDNELHAIEESIRIRQKYAASILYNVLKIGEIVTFNNDMAPKYLCNKKAVLLEKRNKNLLVELIDKADWGRFKDGKLIVSPTSLLEKV